MLSLGAGTVTRVHFINTIIIQLGHTFKGVYIYTRMNQIKKCRKCRIEKLISLFAKDSSRKDGLQPECKECKLQGIKQSGYQYQKQWNGKKREEGYWKKYGDSGYWNDYNKRRRKTDPYYSLYINLRSRISNLLSGRTKSKHTQEIIGLTTDQFKQYIEDKWGEGMKWDNYGYGEGKWVLDHHIPISSAKTEEEIYKLNHYTNLKPMWFKENLMKRDKIV